MTITNKSPTNIEISIPIKKIKQQNQTDGVDYLKISTQKLAKWAKDPDKRSYETQ